MPTKIKKCNCRHEYQDKKYGKYNRVHNSATGKNRSEIIWRCTVCKDEKGN